MKRMFYLGPTMWSTFGNKETPKKFPHIERFNNQYLRYGNSSFRTRRFIKERINRIYRWSINPNINNADQALLNFPHDLQAVYQPHSRRLV